MPIKAVCFDVGGTLAEGELDKRTYRIRVVEYLKSKGYNINLKQYEKALSSLLNRLEKIRAKGFEPNFKEFYSWVLIKLRIHPEKEILEEIKHLYFECFPQYPKSGVEKTLETLHGVYKLAVISNSMSNLPRIFLEEYNLIKYFNVVIISGEVGVRKPNSEIFKLALRNLNVKPWEAVHIGDSLKEDIFGAKRVGMRAIWIKSEEFQILDVEPDCIVNSIREVPKAVSKLDENSIR